ncbi:MAG: hypothetical protein ACJ772_11990, partial [Gemmatimonadaceae bacterium]
MKIAYVDTSCLVAISFGEPRGSTLMRRLKTFDELVSANLLEAELRTTFVRERVPPSSALPIPISWIIPDRPLSEEITRVLDA